MRIDRDRRIVETADGAHLPYDHLILATGSRNRVPPVSGLDLDGVFGLRTLKRHVTEVAVNETGIGVF